MAIKTFTDRPAHQKENERFWGCFKCGSEYGLVDESKHMQWVLVNGHGCILCMIVNDILRSDE